MIDLQAQLGDVLRSDRIKIRFNGHFGVSSEERVFSETWLGLSEQESYTKPTPDWMIQRHTSHFFDTMKLVMLDMEHSIEELSKAIGDKPVENPNGHGRPSPEDLQKWLANEETEFFNIGPFASCPECGEAVCYWFNGVTLSLIRANQTNYTDAPWQCKYAGGIGEYKVQVQVPSGRLVFANDLRVIMPDSKSADDFDINTSLGTMQTVQATAEQNFLTSFVGNTCPSVHVADNKDILIAEDGFDDNDDKTTNFGEEVGSICTDLWWFYAVDGGTFDAAGEIDSKYYGASVACDIEVEPGTYEMTVHKRIAERNRKWTDGYRYVTITRIGDTNEE